MTHLWPFLLPAQAGGEPAGFLSLVPMFLIFGVFYVIWFLPLRKRQKQLDKVLEELTKGDRVITNGGLYGKVVKVDDAGVVLLELADNVRVRVAKRAIGGLEGTQADNGGK
ncbi:MAG: preprotein translocase subunit YajC [Acidobacteriota bacterium]